MMCDILNCKTQFVDSATGLAEMIMHKIVKHDSEEINFTKDCQHDSIDPETNQCQNCYKVLEY